MPKVVFIRQGHNQQVEVQIWHMDDKEAQVQREYIKKSMGREALKTVECTEDEAIAFSQEFLFFKYGKEFIT